jgi:Ca2+-binding EF-hand superfamily protein
MNLITEEDITKCQEIFGYYDEDGVGVIKVTELNKALERVGIKIGSEKEFNERLKKF